MFKYLSNLFKKKKAGDPESKEEPDILDISHEEIKITPILPVGSPPLELPIPVTKPKMVKPVVIVKPKPAVRPEVKVKIKKHKTCPQCRQQVKITDSTCRFCHYKG